MKLSDKIADLRKSGGLSQEDLAEKLNVSRQAVSRWETGTAMPDANNILQISRVFGVTTDYLLNEDYHSDDDIPKVKETKGDHLSLLIIWLVTLEVMVLILQFMTVIILQNAFFAVLSFLPFLAAVGGFEYGYRRYASQEDEQAKTFRRKFYKISAWLGLYFPVRFAVSAAAEWYPRPYSVLVLECIILTIYIGAAFLVNLSIERRRLSSD